MPEYEYRCLACGTPFTLRRSVDSRNDPAGCPACGKPARRKLSVPQAWRGAWSRENDPEKLRRTKEIWE